MILIDLLFGCKSDCLEVTCQGSLRQEKKKGFDVQLFYLFLFLLHFGTCGVNNILKTFESTVIWKNCVVVNCFRIKFKLADGKSQVEFEKSYFIDLSL